MSAAPKVLTQREIDELLDAKVAQAADQDDYVPSLRRHQDKAIKVYDFRRPDKFSKDHLRTLQAMHQSMGRAVSASLSSRLRTGVNIRLSSIEQGLYEEYLAQLANPAVLNILTMEPLEGSIVIEYSIDIGLMIIDRLLGGTGVVGRQRPEVTDIELSLLRAAAEPLVAGVAESWENLMELQPKLQEIGLTSQFTQVARGADVVIMIFFEVQIGDVVGGMSVCLPYAVLEPVMPRLNAQSWISTGSQKRVQESDKENLRSQLLRAPVELSARVGGAVLTTRELVDLAVGDVIRLDRPVNREIDVLIARRRKFRARPGMVGRKMAFRVTAVASAEERAIEAALLSGERT